MFRAFYPQPSKKKKKTHLGIILLFFFITFMYDIKPDVIFAGFGNPIHTVWQFRFRQLSKLAESPVVNVWLLIIHYNEPRTQIQK